MKTKDDVILETINYHVLEGVRNDVEKKKGYGDRIMKGAKIVLADGVKHLGNGEYEVDSGSTEGLKYRTNGVCDCPDAVNFRKHEKGEEVKSFAPSGFCKHKISVVLWGKVQAKLKWTRDKNFIHEHRWDCEEHRDFPVECWQAACPDPTRIPCQTCTPAAPSTVATAEAIIEEAQAETVHVETGEILEEPPADFAPLTTTEYEPAPLLTPTIPALPEAAASLNIKVRMDQFELMYTMRAHTDGDVLERLPNVLATIERLLKSDVDHDASFLQRLAHAFFPRKRATTNNSN